MNKGEIRKFVRNEIVFAGFGSPVYIKEINLWNSNPPSVNMEDHLDIFDTLLFKDGIKLAKPGDKIDIVISKRFYPWRSDDIELETNLQMKIPKGV